ncbi:MAG: MFS transporter [Arachnia sp.]
MRTIINNLTRVRNPAPLLLGTQALFNVGFYAVVPFIAVVLRADFGLGAAAVGLVLGARTFAQQGLFLVGGELADRFGTRGVIALGCALRVSGFLSLAGSLLTAEPLLWLFVVGTVLTGLGGALFSPGINMLVASADAGRRAAGRVSLFAWLTFAGEAGAVLGPLLGAALLGWGFPAVAGTGAALFAVMGVVLWRTVPGDAGGRPRAADRRWSSLRHGAFVRFAATHAVDLLAYNQLYLAIPLEVERLGAGAGLVGLLFAEVSVVTLLLQLPIARWATRVGPATALRTGYASTAAGFGTLATAAAIAPPHTVHLALIGVAVLLMTLGHLTANPTALALVPRWTDGRPTGSHFGALASFGGVAVLLGNVVAGRLFDAADTLSFPPLPWLFLAGCALASATLIRRVVWAGGHGPLFPRYPGGDER